MSIMPCHGLISERLCTNLSRYTHALLLPASNDEKKVIKRNRALAFLNTKQFDAALEDTGFPNFGPEPNEKALFRAAEALYGLSRFQESKFSKNLAFKVNY